MSSASGVSSSPSIAFKASGKPVEHGAEGHLGVHTREAREVHGGEEEVARLSLDALRVPRGDRLLQFGGLLVELRPDALDVRPLEARAGGALADLQRARERGHRAGDACKNRLLPFAAFDRVPVLENVVRPAHDSLAEDVGVAALELIGDGGGDGVEIEGAPLARDPGVEDGLEEEVAELFAQGVVVAGIYGVEGFVGFFEKALAERLMGLLAVPRTTMRREQEIHDRAEA